MNLAGKALPAALLVLSGLAAFPPPAASLSISVSGGHPAMGSPLMVEVSAPGPVDNLSLLWKGAAWPLRQR